MGWMDDGEMAEEDDAMILKFKLTEASSASSKLEVVLLLFFQPSSQLSNHSLLRVIEWVILYQKIEEEEE